MQIFDFYMNRCVNNNEKFSKIHIPDFIANQTHLYHRTIENIGLVSIYKKLLGTQSI